METIIISPKSLLEEKQKHLPETVIISGTRIMFSAKASIILGLKPNIRFLLIIKNNRLFYQDWIQNPEGFLLSVFGKGHSTRYAANAKGLVETLAGLKQKNKNLNLQPETNKKGGLSFTFIIGSVHEGGLWELLPFKTQELNGSQG